jgi:hypothetical protein
MKTITEEKDDVASDTACAVVSSNKLKEPNTFLRFLIDVEYVYRGIQFTELTTSYAVSKVNEALSLTFYQCPWILDWWRDFSTHLSPYKEPKAFHIVPKKSFCITPIIIIATILFVCRQLLPSTPDLHYIKPLCNNASIIHVSCIAHAHRGSN